MIDPVKNLARVTPSSYDASAVTIDLGSGEGAELPQPSSDGAFNMVWWNFSDYKVASNDPNVEIVRVTARSTDQLTVTRAQEGTGATTKNTATKIYKMALCYTKKFLDDLRKYAFGLEKSKPIVSSGTTNIGALASVLISISGTITITAFDNVDEGIIRVAKFTASMILTHNATSLILPSAQNITAEIGDSAVFVSLGSGNWKCLFYQTANASTTEAAAGVEDKKPTTIAKIVHLLRNLTSSIFTAFTQSRTAITVLSPTDQVLLGDASDSNRDKKATIANLKLAMIPEVTAGFETSAVTINASGDFDDIIVCGFKPQFIELHFGGIVVPGTTIGNFSGIYYFDGVTLKFVRGLSQTGSPDPWDVGDDFCAATKAITSSSTDHWSVIPSIINIIATGFTVRFVATKTNNPSDLVLSYGWKSIEGI